MRKKRQESKQAFFKKDKKSHGKRDNKKKKESGTVYGNDHNTLSPFEISVLGVFHKNPTAVYNCKQVASRLEGDDNRTQNKVQQALENLTAAGQLEEPETGRYKAAAHSQYITGKLDFMSSGAAYLVPDDKEKYKDDIYIPSNAVAKGLHGDKVRVYVFRRKPGRRPEGEVVEIISRAKTQFVGRLELSQHFGFVTPGQQPHKHQFLHSQRKPRRCERRRQGSCRNSGMAGQSSQSRRAYHGRSGTSRRTRRGDTLDTGRIRSAVQIYR